MTSITPPADDVGVQSLRQANKTDTDVKSVANIAAKPAIHKPVGAPVTDRLDVEKRQRIERRKKERRQESEHKQQILLDTRSHHDRRTSERRNQGGKSAAHMRGVNIKV